MSGGGGANPTGGQFPAPVVSGLWDQSNQAFQPVPYPNTPQAANNAFGQIGTSGGFAGGGPSTQSLGQDNWNAYNQGFSGQGALNAGNQFTQAAQGQQNQVSPFINQTLQTGFDPQKDLFNQQFNLQRQQGLANQAAAGTSNTPYGAGLSTQGDQNFDIAWQNAQLARQGQAAQNAAGLQGIPAITAGIGNQMLGSGMQLGEGAANFLNNINQQQIQDYLSYLGANTGNSAQLMQAINNSLNAGTNLYGTGGQLNQAFNNANAQGLAGLGTLAGDLGTAALLA